MTSSFKLPFTLHATSLITAWFIMQLPTCALPAATEPPAASAAQVNIIQDSCNDCSTSRYIGPRNLAIIKPPCCTHSMQNRQHRSRMLTGGNPLHHPGHQQYKLLVHTGISHIAKPHDRSDKKRRAQIEKHVGSRPPLCSNKCNACNPCQAVQLPTPNQNYKVPRSSMHVDYSNYQPEGWKCKCGSLIYNP